MSFYALCETTGKTVYTDEPHLFGRKNLICPSCKCTMHYRSVSSNGRTVHFCGKHEPWCTISTAKKENPDKYSYVLPENSI